MNLRDKNTAILVFIAFALSFFALWNISDLAVKMENQKQGLRAYENITTLRIRFDKLEKLAENGKEIKERKYIRNIYKNMMKQIEGFSESNISVTSVHFSIKDKNSNIKAEVVFKANEGLPYEFEQIYNENGQVLLGESMKKYMRTDETGTWIYLSDKAYSVRGILKNYGMGGQDERAIILCESLSPEQKKILLEQMVDDYTYISVMGIDVSSGSVNVESMRDSCTFLTDYFNEIEGAEVTIAPAKKFVGEKNEWYQLFHSIFGNVSVIFAVVNGIVVSNLWYQRRKREFLIRRIFGYNKRSIWLFMWKEIGEIAVSALLCSTVIWVIYMFIKGSKIQWSLIGMQGLIMACATVLVIFITTSFPYLRTMEIEPADGLSRYHAG